MSLLFVLSGRHPNEAIVAEDDAGAAGQLVKVGLPPLNKAGGHLDECALGQLSVLQRSAGNKIQIQHSSNQKKG